MKWFRTLLNVPEPLASWSDAIDGLHAAVLLTAMAGCFGIFAYTAYTLIRYRSRPPFRLTPQIISSTAMKVGTSGGMFLLFMVWWGLGYHTFVRMQSPPADTLDIQVIAEQWMWKFVYPDGTSSAGVVVVPEDKAVRLLMTSRDVIHSFFVPALRVKRDVVPGQTTEMWFEAVNPGTFPVYCAEFCGVDHSLMRASMVVLEPASWARWAASRAPLYADAPGFGPAASLADLGREVAAQKGCLRCHTVDGVPDLGPSWVGVYGSEVRFADGTTGRADEAYLTQSMMDPMAEIVAGYPPVMPTYRGLLTPEDVGALIAYLRLLATGPDRGNR